MVTIDILGSLYFFGVDLNSIPFTVVVMSVGLTVDYSAHILHNYYTVSDAPVKARARAAEAAGKGIGGGGVFSSYAGNFYRLSEVLGGMGRSVFFSGLSTFVGMLPLAFASSFINRLFF